MGKDSNAAKSDGESGSSKGKSRVRKSAPEKSDMNGKQTKRGSRHAAYAELADRFATGASIALPTHLSGHGRRRHVRETLLEDHAHRIDTNAEGTQEKFDVIADDLFSFFRGTALLFYRDMAGMDAARPKVLLLGDVHPENFGIMPDADNTPIFSVNDFDEVTYGPYSWDLKRGAAGFILAAKCQGGLKRKKRRKIAKAFVRGYIEGLRHAARFEDDTHHVFRMDNAPDLICRLFESAACERAEWLAEEYQDETRKAFRPTEELQPVSSRVDEFQVVLDALAERNGIEKGGRFGELRVKDVAIRHGAGCASLGLTRFYLMVEGPEKDGTDDMIVEIKRARRSALDGIVPLGNLNPGKRAERIANGQAIHIPHGDVFYGAVEVDGTSYMTRERAPFRDDMDLDDLDYGEWKDYARACGHALALAHARTDDAGQIDYDVKAVILADMQPNKLFVHDIAGFAEEAADMLKADWKQYRRDHELGAFTHRIEAPA